MSDLHLEWCGGVASLRAFTYAEDSDALILAGDIGEVDDVYQTFKDWPVPVLAVLGNHEFYGAVYEDVRERAAKLSALDPSQFRFLDPGVAVIGDTRIIGCTLWTDGNLYGNVEDGLFYTGALNDYVKIKRRHNEFTPRFTASECIEQLGFLKRSFAQPWEGKTLIVTHHAPSVRGAAPQFIGSKMNPGFASNFEHVVDSFGAPWCHGHMHNSSDYSLGNGRVIANPRGYPGRLKDGQIVFENSTFDPLLTIIV
jgi:3',5'-cyclic AMP phosphodiesterase CpdA